MCYLQDKFQLEQFIEKVSEWVFYRILISVNPQYVWQENVHWILIFYWFVNINFENLHLINDHFKTIFGNFSAKYISVFDKNEYLTVILRCLVCLIST